MDNIAAIQWGESMSRNLRKFRMNAFLDDVSTNPAISFFFSFFLQPAVANLFLHKSFRILKRGTTETGRVENYHRAKMKVAINRLNSVKHGTLTDKICSSFFFLSPFIPFFLFFLSSFYLRFPSSSSLHTSSLKES